MTFEKLPVENVLNLERASVELMDTLAEKYLFICNEGKTIGRRIGVYGCIRELLEEVAKLTEKEILKSSESGEKNEPQKVPGLDPLPVMRRLLLHDPSAPCLRLQVPVYRTLEDVPV